MWNPGTCDCVIRYVKARSIWLLKILHAKKCLIGRLALACEDKILNTTEIPIDNIKETCEKSNCLIHAIALAIICLLILVVTSISYYCYYTRYWIKKEHALPY